jgi:hypothetical protein
VPPNNGNNILPNIGCRININNALRNKVPAKAITGIADDGLADEAC